MTILVSMEGIVQELEVAIWLKDEVDRVDELRHETLSRFTSPIGPQIESSFRIESHLVQFSFGSNVKDDLRLRDSHLESHQLEVATGWTG